MHAIECAEHWHHWHHLRVGGRLDLGPILHSRCRRVTGPGIGPVVVLDVAVVVVVVCDRGCAGRGDPVVAVVSPLAGRRVADSR